MKRINRPLSAPISIKGSTFPVFRHFNHTPGSDFGSEFQRIFKARHGKPSETGEVELFRLVMAVINGLIKTGLFGNGAVVNELHGSGHQVIFDGNGIHAPTNARCELCDLMTIIYSLKRKDVRLSFIQAKYERKRPVYPVKHDYKGDLKQWFLLAMRPKIRRYGNFDPPIDLLSSAILPSIGSFLFFHWALNDSVDMFYCSADDLNPTGNIRRGSSGQLYANGRLTPKASPTPRTYSGYQECVWAQGAAEFATNLYELKIGSPIELNVPNSLPTRAWLSALLINFRNNGLIDGSVDVINNLLKLLDVPDVPDEMPEITSFVAKAILIIDSDSAYEPLAGELVEMSFLERLQYCSGKTEIQSLLNEAADYVNSLTAGADGNYKVVLCPPESLNGLDLPNEFKNKWIVDASGGIKWRTSSSGAETWDAKDFPTGVYSGNSANEAAEQFLISVETALFGIDITNDTLKGQK